MTRMLAILVAPLTGVLVAGSLLAGPTEPEAAPEAVQRVWVEQDGITVWEVECPADLTAQACLKRDVVADLLGADDTRTVLFDALAGEGGTYTVHAAPQHEQPSS